MNSSGSVFPKTSALMVASLMTACVAPGGEEAEMSAGPEQVPAAVALGGADQDYGELAGIWSEFGGLSYGGAGKTLRGRGSVQRCSAGPMGPILPNRFVVCVCDQLVKSCQDSGCSSCSNPRYEECSSSSWFSGIRFSYGNSCTESELDACQLHCQQSCTPSCS